MAVVLNNFNNPIFDVVEYIKKLRNAGVSQEVAEIQGQEIERVVYKFSNEIKTEIKQELHANELVTKSDLKQQLEIVKLELQKEIAELRYATLKFVIWTGCGVSIVILGGMFTMLKLMLRV